MRLFTLKEKNLKFIFFLIFGVYSMLVTFNVNAQKLLFKDCYVENNIDSLENWLILNQKSINVDRLKNLIKLDRAYFNKAAIFEKLEEIKILSDRLKNNTGLCYYYFEKAYFFSNTNQKESLENLYLGHLYLDKSDDLELKQMCYAAEFFCYLSMEMTTQEVKSPKAKSFFHNKIEINENQYNLLDEFQKALYLACACVAEMNFNGFTLKYKKYIDEWEYIVKKYPKLEHSKTAQELYSVLYYENNHNYDKAINICKKSIERLDSTDIFLKLRTNYILANIYIKTNKLQLASNHFKKALFYFNSIEYYNYSQLSTQYRIVYFQGLIANFLQTRYKLNNNIVKTNRNSKDYFKPIMLDINAMLGLILSLLEKESKIIVLKQNENLLAQKEKNALLLKASELAKTRAEVQKIMILQEVSKQKYENEKLAYKNQEKKYFILLCAIVLLLFLYFLFRLYRLNSSIKKEQIYKERFFALFSHDLRGVVTNLKDSGEVLSYLLKNNRYEDIVEISKKLDWDGCHALLLINNMLDWGVLTSYDFQPVFRQIDLSNKVWDIISIYKLAIESKGIKLSIDIENGLSVYSDEKSVDVVLRNIIANAKSHSQIGGDIIIRLEKQKENKIDFIVTNSATEFKRGKLVHIQNILAGKTKPKVGHHGLGLGVILIHEYSKNIDINLKLSYNNGFATFKVSI